MTGLTIADNQLVQDVGNEPLLAILARISTLHDALTDGSGAGATEASLLQVLTALALLHTDDQALHTDIATTLVAALTTLHTDLGTTLHADLTATLAVALQRFGFNTRPLANFNRPADTTAYASGDLVANSTVAGSVTPMQFAVTRVAGYGAMLRRCRVRKSGTSLTNAQFRLHLYSSAPTPSNGDNGAWLTNGMLNYIGSMDVTMDKAFTDGAAGNGVPTIGAEMNTTADTIYGLLEARAAYTPVSGETFTVDLENLQN